jgi:hypothetical protein
MLQRALEIFVFVQKVRWRIERSVSTNNLATNDRVDYKTEGSFNILTYLKHKLRMNDLLTHNNNNIKINENKKQHVSKK